MDSQAKLVCKPLKTNSTESIPGWEGIPEATVLNALIATVSLIILSIVRIIYFKWKPYENDWNISWLQFIYSDRNVSVLHTSNHINRMHPNAYHPICLHEYSDLITNKLPEGSPSSSLYVVNTVSEKMKKKHQEKLDSVGRYRYWLLDYLLIKDKDIYEHRGNDAFQYLLFQRYIIYIMAALTAACMIILLPINMMGKKGGQRYFEMTTINNINENSNSLWIHTIVAILIVILGLIMMKNFSDLIFTPTIESDDRTIFIQNVPEAKRNARLLKNFIEKKFLGVEVTQIWFTYDVETLAQLKKQQACIESAIIYTEKYLHQYGVPLQVSPQLGGRFLPLCPTEDAATYYLIQKDEYRMLVDAEINRLLTEPKHAVFLQLKNELMAQRILEHFDNTSHERVFKRFFRSLKSWFVTESVQPSEVDSFCYHSWTVKAAPFPDDIEWKDIVMNHNTSGICTIVLNILVLLIFIFLTTPLVATNYLSSIVNSALGSNGTVHMGSAQIQLAKYLSILIFNTFSMILPNLVLVIVLMTPRNTKSEKNYKAMQYMYLFLIFMVLIFPTIGLNSFEILLRHMFENAENESDRKNRFQKLFKCLFQPDSSVWFVQMVISSIFINNSLELLRLPELCTYLMNCIIYPRTEAEYIKARVETGFEFSYGSSYPRFLLIFTIVTTYSISCPIIAPFGLLYMVCKHLVDRYSIYYLYNSPVINPNIHEKAITFVLTSFFFLISQLTALLNSHIDFSVDFKPSNVCTVVCLLYLILLFFACCNFSSLYSKDSSNSQIHLSSVQKQRRLKSQSPGN